MSAIQSVINIEKIHCWTDSLTALFWIQGRDKEWKMFVENRVIEIRSWVQTECWSHCPGVDNPADIPPRGMTATQLKNNRVWFHGPSWLVEIENKWPTPKHLTQLSQECSEEMKVEREKTSVIASLVTTQVKLTSIIDRTRISNFQRLLRITAYVIRFVNRVQKRTETMGNPTTAEMKDAETLRIKEAQRNVERNQLEKQLGLFNDEDGIIRCRDGLDNAELPYVSRFPALLSRHHWMSTIIIRQCHDDVWLRFDQGIGSTKEDKQWRLSYFDALSAEMYKGSII